MHVYTCTCKWSFYVCVVSEFMCDKHITVVSRGTLMSEADAFMCVCSSVGVLCINFFPSPTVPLS